MLGPLAIPMPINEAASSSLINSGNLEMNEGEAAKPEDVEGRPSLSAIVGGADWSGGVSMSAAAFPSVGSREDASGEKLNSRLSGGGTLARANLAASEDSFCPVCIVREPGPENGPLSVVGDGSGQFDESGVRGVEIPGPKSNLKPVSTRRLGRPVSDVGVGRDLFGSGLQLG